MKKKKEEEEDKERRLTVEWSARASQLHELILKSARVVAASSGSVIQLNGSETMKIVHDQMAPTRDDYRRPTGERERNSGETVATKVYFSAFWPPWRGALSLIRRAPKSLKSESVVQCCSSGQQQTQLDCINDLLSIDTAGCDYYCR